MADDKGKLEQLCKKTYKDQAVWFLNASWREFNDQQKQKVWDYKHKCDELDLDKKKEGCELDELNAHRFLEFFKETMTVQQMRDQLRKVGAIDKVKFVPLLHLLLVLFNKDYHKVVNAPQGNKAEIEEAQRRLDAVLAALSEAESKAQAAKAALAEAQAREAEATAKEAESVAAQKELEAALAELKAQEDAHHAKTEELKRKSEDQGASLVSRNKAKNELAQHLGTDPLPLRRAKLGQEAAVRKAEKATAAAIDARARAQAATAASEEAAASAEAALEEAKSRVAEAEAYLEEVKTRGGGEGSLWWIEKELHEAKAYLPTSKGGYAKKPVLVK